MSASVDIPNLVSSAGGLSDLSSAVGKRLDEREAELHAHHYHHAGAYLALHSEVSASLAQLDGLSSFLSTFRKDLASVSGHIADLQGRSRALDEQLRGRRELDRMLSKLVAEVTISPRLVDLFFDSDPRQGGWAEAVEDLERVLDATSSVAQYIPAELTQPAAAASAAAPRTPLSAVLPASLSSASIEPPPAAGPSTDALAQSLYQKALSSDPSLPPTTPLLIESRLLAAACLAVAVRKLRPYLVSFFHPFKSSTTANLQILQSSLLLKPGHRGLYAFLARQAPRVAIDVQRAYLVAARLYFETGFRRYTRALEKIRVRSLGWTGSRRVSTAVDGARQSMDAGRRTSTASVGGMTSSVSSSSIASSSAGAASGAVGSASPSSSSEGLIGEASPTSMSGAALALFSRATGSAPSSTDALLGHDTLFLLDETRVAQSRLDADAGSSSSSSSSSSSAGAVVILAYMADNARFKAPPEALFRSLALTFFDNASAEYVFLVRYFESLPVPAHKRAQLEQRQARRRRREQAAAAARPDNSRRRSTAASIGARTPGPDDSASMFGGETTFDDGATAVTGDTSVVGGEVKPQDGTETPAEADAEETDVGNIATLTRREQRARRGKGVEEELWKQVMEPVLGHWTTFTKALLTSVPPPPLLSLLSMVALNESLMAAADARGVSSVLQGPLLQFKIEAFPLVQSSFEEHMQSLRRLMTLYGIPLPARPLGGSGAAAGGVGASAAGVAAAAVAGLTSWSGLTGLVNAAANATATFSPGEKLASLRLVSLRFARLFVSIVQLLGDDEHNANMVFGSMGRLRDEVEHLVKEGGKVVMKDEAKKGIKPVDQGQSQGTRDKQIVSQCADLVCRSLADNGGRASVSHARMQIELAHWNELRSGHA